MSDWRTVTLGEVTDNHDVSRRPVKTSERIAGPYPYYGASGVIDFVSDFIYDGDYLLIAEDGENLRSRTTPIAFLASGKFWVNNHAHVVQGNERADTRFLSHLLSIADVSAYLTGSTLPKLTRSAMDSILLKIPDKAEQIAIAEVLGALDDKIATNVDLARTIDDYLAALLIRPSAQVVDEVLLREIADVNAETIMPTSEGWIRYIDIASVGVGQFDFPSISEWASAPSRARRRVRRGDTLWSTVRPDRRSHALNLSDDPLLVGSTGLAVLSPRDTGFAYLYEVTKRPEFTTYLDSVAEGSAYPAVRADRLGEAPVPLFPASALECFESIAAPMREHAFILSEQNRTLAMTRDALLLELMSGKLRVRDVEKTVEEVL